MVRHIQTEEACGDSKRRPQGLTPAGSVAGAQKKLEAHVEKPMWKMSKFEKVESKVMSS